MQCDRSKKKNLLRDSAGKKSTDSRNINTRNGRSESRPSCKGPVCTSRQVKPIIIAETCPLVVCINYLTYLTYPIKGILAPYLTSTNIDRLQYQPKNQRMPTPSRNPSLQKVPRAARYVRVERGLSVYKYVNAHLNFQSLRRRFTRPFPLLSSKSAIGTKR